MAWQMDWKHWGFNWAQYRDESYLDIVVEGGSTDKVWLYFNVICVGPFQCHFWSSK